MITLHEDRRRVEAIRLLNSNYDPLTGRGSLVPRREVLMSDGRTLFLPLSMIAEPRFSSAMTGPCLDEMRMSHDFEYWCARCVTIRDKLSGQPVPFILNRPQRRLASLLERERIAGRPIRVILLKARQWGGSTLVQMYFAWIQIILRRGWNSLICAHVKDTAATIREMYAQLLECYPRDLWPGEGDPGFKGIRNSLSRMEICGTGSKIAIGSAMAPDALRGNNFSLAHLSEVAFWSDTPRRKPLSFLRTVCGSIPTEPSTAIVLESTANGTGNFFHQAWVEAERGDSAYLPVFVPWFESDIYSADCPEAELEQLADSLSDYEMMLWQLGATLGQIKWYRTKLLEYPDHAAMKAEFPSTPTEAFANTGRCVFSEVGVDRLRGGCRDKPRLCAISARASLGPAALHGITLVDDPRGALKVWRAPELCGDMDADRRRYIVTVDIGGRSLGSDWSVIAVLDRHGPSGKPEIVAQWRGHADHDIVGWMAAQIATLYGEALLVVESNSLESGMADDASLYVLMALRLNYRHLYFRASVERRTQGLDSHPGFHTNRRTKQASVSALIAAVRDGSYIERDPMACDELSWYEERSNGSFGAIDGRHDDILMTRAIAMYVLAESRTNDPVGSPDPWWE